MKEISRTAHSIKNFHEYIILKKWVQAKFGDKAIIEFYQLQPEARIELLKTNIKEMAKQLTPKKDRKDGLVYSTKNNKP